MPEAGYKYYDSFAKEYFSKTINASTENIAKFLSLIDIDPKGKSVLDLGCGSCRDTVVFKNLGSIVTPLDGSAELAKVVKNELDIDVVVQDMMTIDYQNQFDIIWACASLVHLTKENTIKVLKKLANAIKQDGNIYVSVKLGAKAEQNRYFETYTEEEFLNMVRDSGLEPINYWHNDDSIGRVVDWFNVICKKN